MDIRVRRAMSMAINRNALTERVMEKLAVPAANIVSPGVFGHNAQLKPEAYDPDGAKKLLTEAGYPNGFGITGRGPVAFSSGAGIRPNWLFCQTSNPSLVQS